MKNQVYFIRRTAYVPVALAVRFLEACSSKVRQRGRSRVGRTFLHRLCSAFRRAPGGDGRAGAGQDEETHLSREKGRRRAALPLEYPEVTSG